ncbi:reverse transcriptase domain-containing protein [Tanacetum coccineum]
MITHSLSYEANVDAYFHGDYTATRPRCKLLPEDDPVHSNPLVLSPSCTPQPELCCYDDIEDDEEETNTDEDPEELEESSSTSPLLPLQQMFDRYKTEIRMVKKFKEDDLCMNLHEYNITALDVAVRDNSSDYSKMMKFVEGLKEPFEPPIHPTFAPRSDNPYVMVRDATDTQDDERYDTTAPMDSQPSEPRGSPPEALATDRATRNNTNVARGSGGSGGQGRVPPIREYTFVGFMKCGPTQYHYNEGAVELCHWFKKTVSVFRIIATLGLAVANGKSWDYMKKMMLEEFCPSEEIQRLENKLRSLKLRDTNIGSYTQRFNELALLCPEAVPSEKKKVELYIKGDARAMTATQNDGVDQGGPALNYNRCGLCHFRQCPPKCNWCGKTGHKTNDYRKRIVATGANTQPIRACYECGDRNHNQSQCLNRNNQRGGNATGQAYAIRDAEQGQGPNVVTGTFLLNNRYAIVLFDSGSDKSFVKTSFSHLIDIKPVRLNTSYEVELADGKIVSTNTVLRGYTLNLINHLFEIDIMPIELGTFDNVIGMNWLVEQDAVIVLGKKEVHICHTPRRGLDGIRV